MNEEIKKQRLIWELEKEIEILKLKRDHSYIIFGISAFYIIWGILIALGNIYFK